MGGPIRIQSHNLTVGRGHVDRHVREVHAQLVDRRRGPSGVGIPDDRGRLPTSGHARRALYRWTGLTGRWLDPHFGCVPAGGKREAWFQDQYCHPHESCHTLDEVYGWLAENNLEFVNAIPKPGGGRALSSGERLFEPKNPGTVLSRMWSQLRSLPSGFQEGGFFLVIARRL